MCEMTEKSLRKALDETLGTMERQRLLKQLWKLEQAREQSQELPQANARDKRVGRIANPSRHHGRISNPSYSVHNLT